MSDTQFLAITALIVAFVWLVAIIIKTFPKFTAFVISAVFWGGLIGYFGIVPVAAFLAILFFLKKLGD